MRKSIKKIDRPDFTMSPLMSGLKQAFRSFKGLSKPLSAVPSHKELTTNSAIRFEALESRVLLSGDLNPAQAVSGSIDVQGEVDQYGFTLSQNTQIVFDSLTNNANMNWSLSGPNGAVVGNRSFTNSDSVDASVSPLLNLAVGDYTLTVDANSDQTGAYSFRLIDVLKAQEVVPGTDVAGTLDLATQTNVYKFNATAGEHYYFNSLNLTGGNAYWRLIDPNGNNVFAPTNFTTDVDIATPVDGSYTLLVEGRISATGSSNYSFNVQKVTDDQSTLILGETVNSSIAHVGQRDFYNFSLGEAKQLYFDALSNSNVNWTLTGPRGAVVSGKNFTSTDAASLSGSAIYDLVAGDYTLIIDGNTDMVGNYSFRLLDIAQATSITPGTPVIGQFTPANETELYQFNVSAGDQYVFDSQGLSNTAYWRLLDPYGQLVFGPSSMGSDTGSITLNQTGIYTLLTEGYLSSTGTTNYQFNVVYQGNVPIAPLPTGTALALGTTVTGILPTTLANYYSFTLSSDSSVYFDALTNNGSVNWTLAGPRGTVLSARSFTGSDSVSLGGATVIQLVAGTYSLRINGPASTGYSFRVLDVAQAAALTPGTTVSGQLSPANETDLYQFNAVAGERFYFDYKSYSGSVPYWRLLDPYGQVVFGPDVFYSDKEPLTLTQTGIYTLLVEGYINSTGTNNYSFNVQKVTDEQSTLTLGNTVNGSIAHVGQRDFYNFNLSEAKQLYFDALSNSNVNWTLVGPRGTMVSGRNFTNTDAGSLGGSTIYGLVAGDYTLIIDGNTDMVGNYSFRVLDIAQATALTLGATVSSQLSPANETDLYQFNVTAGERFYFDYKSVSGNTYTPYWRLLAPNGQLVFGPDGFSSDKEPLTLTQTGAYTLLIEGYVYETGATNNYSFAVQKVTDEQFALTLGNTVNGSIAHVGQRDFYSFSLSEAKQLYFDALSNSNVNWTLVGSKGTVVSGRNFTSTDAGSLGGSAIYALLAGDYTLIIDGNTDMVGNYSFRVLDISPSHGINLGSNSEQPA